MIVKTRAVILREIKYRDQSKICSIYTRDFGKMSVIIKGARNPKNRLSSLFNAGNVVDLVQEEHRKFLQNLGDRLGESDHLYQFLKRIAMKISARNIFSGTVEKIVKGAVNAEVVLLLSGGNRIVAIITNGSVDNLELKEGLNAYAIIKASSIIIGQELHEAKISTRNILPGIISKLIEGPVSTEVDVEIGGGNVISAVITHGSSEKMSLKEGDHACAAFKASSVIIGIS